MDGVTDASFRYMVCTKSSPDLVMTEFTNVEGLARGAVTMLRAFHYSGVERPVVAQIYGVEVESFYSTTVMLASLGFDGVDINMGCPANKVAKLGSGAGLIRTPELAKELVRACQRGAWDWHNGISLEEAGVHPDIIEACKSMRPRPLDEMPRDIIPVSVKTRVGFDEVVTEEWTKHLLEVEPANLSMHGRTLKQMYTGLASWEEIAKSAALCKDLPISFLGNGDVKSMSQARELVNQIPGLDGVLIGRATFGNPWFFGDHEPTKEERLQAAVDHADYLEANYPDQAFFTIRKHLAWYCQGFEGAREMRKNLMQTMNAKDVRQVVQQHKST